MGGDDVHLLRDTCPDLGRVDVLVGCALTAVVVPRNIGVAIAAKLRLQPVERGGVARCALPAILKLAEPRYDCLVPLQIKAVSVCMGSAVLAGGVPEESTPAQPTASVMPTRIEIALMRKCHAPDKNGPAPGSPNRLMARRMPPKMDAAIANRNLIVARTAAMPPPQGHRPRSAGSMPSGFIEAVAVVAQTRARSRLSLTAASEKSATASCARSSSSRRSVSTDSNPSSLLLTGSVIRNVNRSPSGKRTQRMPNP